MFDKFRQAHLHAHDWRQESLTFVPLRGTWFAQSEHSFDLEEEITKFLFSDKKVLLLLGDSGSGKSLYTQGLASKLWQDHKADSPIPVWISLPSLKNPVNRAIEEAFEKFGFSAEQIASLKQKNTFIFIFDAFDEIHQLKSLWVSNQLDQWKAKIIITCRREYLYHVDNYKHFFTPFNGEKALYLEYEEMIIKPFSEEQIELYIKQYIQHQKPEWKLEQYQKAIEEMPGLKNLIKTPFLLKLAMEALPKMPQEKEQKYMTQAKLYDVFIEQWFIRQEQKLRLVKKIKQDEDIKPEFWDYAKRLAQLMHQQKTTLVTYDSSQISDLFGEIEDNPWQKFFNPDNPRIELLRTACLVREVGAHQYAFIHGSLLEYFLTRDLFEKLLSKQEEVKVKEETSKISQPERKKQDYFNERLLVEEANTLQFLADRVEEDEGFKKTLFDRVYASRSNPQASIGASNAITILNRAGVSFSGMNLSDIHAPKADLYGALMSYTSLCRADLEKVIFTGAYLGKADFREANLKGANFGEYPGLSVDNLYEEISKKTIAQCICYNKDGSYVAVACNKTIIVFIKGDGFNDYKKLGVMRGHRDKVFCLAFNPKGNLLASGSGFDIDNLSYYPPDNPDSTVRIWDINKQQQLAVMNGHSQPVRSVAFSPDAKLLASGSYDKSVHLWDVDNKRLLLEIRYTTKVHSIAFSPDGKRLVSGGLDGSINIWDIVSQKHIVKWIGHNDSVFCVAFSPNGKLFATGSADQTVRLWDISKPKQLVMIKGHTQAVRSVAFSPDGKLLASGSHDRTVRLWDVIHQKPIVTLKGHVEDLESVVFSPDGKTLATGGMGRMVHLWKLVGNLQLPVEELDRNTDEVVGVVFSPGGKVFASGCMDQTVFLWDIASRKLLTKINSRHLKKTTMTFSLDGKHFACGNKIIQFSESFNQKVLAELNGDNEIDIAAFSPDGSIFAFVSSKARQSVCLVDIINKKPLTEFKLQGGVRSIAFSPKGNLIAAVQSHQKTLFLWDVICQKQISVIIENVEINKMSEMTFSPNGKMFLVVIDQKIFMWDVTQQELVDEWEIYDDVVTSVAFSWDGKLFAYGTIDGRVFLKDVITRQVLVILNGHTDIINSICFSPDGKWLVTGSSDMSIFLWEKISIPSIEEEKWALVHRFEVSHALLAESALFKDAKISNQNFELLKQRGSSRDPVQIVDVSDAQEQVVKMTDKEIELKDKPISTIGITSSFWSSLREQIPTQPPTPTKDTASTSFTF